tara:strand:- start:5372 stop:6970 length:1599 start_codon:yes stop_codon:yes gene_type:complete
MARYGFTITVDTGQMPSSQVDFVWLATIADFPVAAVDGGAQSILNGGGNLRCYTDDTKVTQLPIEVVTFVTGGTPDIQLWGLSSTLNVASTVYIEADTVATAQPSVGAGFGRNAVWVNYSGVWHLEEDPSGGSPQIIDSTGNGNDGTSIGSMVTGDLVAANIGDGLSFDGVLQNIDCGSGVVPTGTTAFTVSAWLKMSGGGTKVAIGNASADFWFGINGGKATFSPSGTVASTTNVNDGVYHHISGQKTGTASSIRVDGVNEATGSAGASTPGVGVTALGEFGTIGFNFPGDIDEARISLNSISDDYVTSEHNNQSSSAFWSVGAWIDQDASSGISIAVTLGAIEYNSNDTIVGLAGNVDITATLGSISYSSNDTTIGITGSVDVIATLGAIDYSSNDASIQISGETNVTATLGAIEYSSNDTAISLFGNVDVVATLGAINYNSNDVSISLAGGVNVNATLGAIDYTSNDTVIGLQGQVTLIATLGTISYDSNNAIVQIGTGQIIGNVTAGFADNLYSAGFKPSSITVNFKT